MLAELGMSSIPSVFPIPHRQNAFDENGVPKDAKYHDRAKKFLDELEWYAYALQNARTRPCARGECAAAALKG